MKCTDYSTLPRPELALGLLMQKSLRLTEAIRRLAADGYVCIGFGYEPGEWPTVVIEVPRDEQVDGQAIGGRKDGDCWQMWFHVDGVRVLWEVEEDLVTPARVSRLVDQAEPAVWPVQRFAEAS